MSAEAPSGTCADEVRGELSDLGRRRADADAAGLEGFLLGLRRAGGAGDDRAGVAHRLAGRRREAGDVGDDGLRHLGVDVLGCLLLLGAADLADDDHDLGLVVRLELGEHVDEARSDDGVTADADDGRAAEPELCELVADLVRERPGPADEADPALAEDLGRDDADVRLPRRQRAGAVRPEHRDALRADVVVDPQHLVGREPLSDADHGLDARDNVRPVVAVADTVERAFAAGQPLDDERGVVVDDDRHQCPSGDAAPLLGREHQAERTLGGAKARTPWRRRGSARAPRDRGPEAGVCCLEGHLLAASDHQTVERDPAVLNPFAEELADPLRVLFARARPCEPWLDLDRLLEATRLVDLQTGGGEAAAPLTLRPVLDVRGIAHVIRLLGIVVEEEVVDHDHSVAAHPGHLGHRLRNVVEVVCRDAADDDVEALVGKRDVLAPADDIGLHAGRGIDGDDVQSRCAQPAGRVTSTGGDVECRFRAFGPLDDEIEVLTFAMRFGVAVELRALAPAHAASSTARFAASSIVGSTWRFFGGASRRSSLPSSAFVPSSRTTIGSPIVICSSAWRIPRATSSQRVIPPKMLNRIDSTCGSALMISSASTTPCASPPPPRSQKFAGRPPARATTSSVDMTSPAPLPSTPTSPSSLTYVTSFSRAFRSSGGYASRSRISAMSACL